MYSRTVKYTAWTLLDTSSPISLIRPSAFEKIFGLNPILVESSHLSNDFQSSRGSPSNFRFKAINNVPIKIAERISTTIVLQVLLNLVANIDFHVLERDHCSLDLIIGRDFIKNNSITVLYSPSDKDLESKVLLFQEIASTEIVTDRANES